VTLLLLLALASAQPRQTPQRHQPRAADVRCTDPLEYQVRLDRIGFSAGEIDGTAGANLRKAVAAFQESQKLPGAGQLNCDTLRAIEAQAAGPLITDYTISDHDAAGPFLARPLPSALPGQATLQALSYQSLTEEVAERFHASPLLLRRLNPHVHVAAGTRMRVPDVAPFDEGARPKALASEQVTVHVSRNGTLRAMRPDGRIVMFAPVTSGSEHDPLPLGHGT
jgi:hypothetical protein